MKLFLFSGSRDIIRKSGVGQAMVHQERALAGSEVAITTNPKDDYDLVHINTVFLDSYLCAKYVQRHDKPIVYHAHSTEEDFRNSFKGSNFAAKFFRIWIKQCYNTGDLLITPTNYSKRLIEAYGIKSPIRVLTNGIDTANYNRNDGWGREFREKYGYSATDKVVMSVGMMIERKGILDFIEMAWAMPEYQFIWFGHSKSWAIPNKIVKGINHKPPNLTFAGFVEQFELKKAYSGADVFMFMSKEETEGIVVLEALAMEIPILVRDIPVYADWLQEGVNAYLARDFKEFSQKLEQILNQELPDLTANGRKTALEKDITETGKQLVAIYKEAIALHEKKASARGRQAAKKIDRTAE